MASKPRHRKKYTTPDSLKAILQRGLEKCREQLRTQEKTLWKRWNDVTAMLKQYDAHTISNPDLSVIDVSSAKRVVAKGLNMDLPEAMYAGLVKSVEELNLVVSVWDDKLYLTEDAPPDGLPCSVLTSEELLDRAELRRSSTIEDDSGSLAAADLAAALVVLSENNEATPVSEDP